MKKSFIRESWHNKKNIFRLPTKDKSKRTYSFLKRIMLFVFGAQMPTSIRQICHFTNSLRRRRRRHTHCSIKNLNLFAHTHTHRITHVYWFIFQFIVGQSIWTSPTYCSGCEAERTTIQPQQQKSFRHIICSVRCDDNAGAAALGRKYISYMSYKRAAVHNFFARIYLVSVSRFFSGVHTSNEMCSYMYIEKCK